MQPDPIETVPALTLQRVDHVDATTGRQVRRRRPLVERDRLGRRGSITEVDPQVAGIDTERFRTSHLDVAAEEQRLAVADPERG